MNRVAARWSIATLIVAILAIPVRSAAAHATPQYISIDLGTLGGPQSYPNLPGYPITNRGMVLGTSDTTTPDADYPNFNPFVVGFPNPYLAQAFAWQHGRITNLGALPGNNSSAVFQVNVSGVGTGMSETNTYDPQTGWPSEHAVLFKDGRVIDLGTLSGGYESQACCITDRGKVAGFGSNRTPDAFSFFGTGTQWRSFVWRNGVMKDIGTLGGPDTLVNIMNSRGQMTGQSYAGNTPNVDNGPACAPNVPTQDPFLWQNGTMIDLGTLGGTCGTGIWINNRGEVVGQSDVAGNQSFLPFLWNGSRMLPLPTLGGSFGSATWINDAGHVAGWTTTPGDATAHGVLWENGRTLDLGTVLGQPCSFANAVNAEDQVVGGSCTAGAIGWLWEHGTLYDLNSFATPSDLHLAEALSINDRGEIAGLGVLPNGNQHLVLLVPSELAHARGLTSNVPVTSAGLPTARSSTPAQIELSPLLHGSRHRGYHHRAR